MIWAAASVLYETRFCISSPVSGPGCGAGRNLPQPPPWLTDFWTQHDGLFTPDAYPDLLAVQRKWAEVEGEQADFVNGVTNDSLQRIIPVRTTQITLAHLMQHLANHSTYHRGQVSLMMRQLLAKPVATDFAMFLMQTRS